jgi:hypothetical protein
VNNSSIQKKCSLFILLFLILTILFPIINGTSHEELTNIESSEWRQLIGGENAGFGKNSNIGLRGIEVFNDELFLGTQSFNKSKILEVSNVDKLLLGNYFFNDDLSHSIPLIKIKNSPFLCLLSKNLRYYDYFFMPWLSNSLKLAMHMRSKMSDGCEIWKYNYSSDSWSQVVGDKPEAMQPLGFGDKKNLAASVFKEFKGKLYVGTWSSPLNGCEIWRFDGLNWEQVVGKSALVKGGFNDSGNIAAWCMEEFNDFLYIGTMNWDYTQSGSCQVYRSNDGVHWTKVVDRGFRDFLSDSEQNVHNTYAWSIKSYKNHLYIGTFNTNSVFNFENSGCQLWRTSEGLVWEKVECPGGNGFGESENYGIRSMDIFNDDLIIATATDAYQPNGLNVQGCEIWKYNGETWTEIIGDGKNDENEKDGFGNTWNKYIWSIDVTSDAKLWVGTLNMQIRVIGENTKGCEVWCYDGINWSPVVKDGEGEIDNGFGYIYNEGARVMKEYPSGSGNMVVGTFKIVKPPKLSEGCEVWIRYNSIT